ncbi:hypothetical protein I302_103454 [Kwoniella bestiolae CBS 10118]|uniref:Hyaluronan/mRNA-binding protein domain-containing protein n=1 Tax=Kwoniella bestiolae CBS 10118 TaxID=1296100 RepID=A0A1B9G8I1_9TREE|nr:hypothetical protein I302_02154 [Kwoniella bestiolae CBS 10118]OCF27313.1 hypothetical protein I302_02154 [Kwoniella bestiolae CBS 10118]
MTRTERAQNPAAISKDRHSRSGLTKTELSHKGGDGAHNWGSWKTKGQDEISGREDANGEIFQLDEDQAKNGNRNGNKAEENDNDVIGNLRGNGNNDVEGNIARSPAESTGSLDRPTQGRRMSSYSEEEKKEALQYRGGWHKAGVDLAHIARTSYGIAQSPPLATSPSNVKHGFNFNK